MKTDPITSSPKNGELSDRRDDILGGFMPIQEHDDIMAAACVDSSSLPRSPSSFHPLQNMRMGNQRLDQFDPLSPPEGSNYYSRYENHGGAGYFDDTISQTCTVQGNDLLGDDDDYSYGDLMNAITGKMELGLAESSTPSFRNNNGGSSKEFMNSSAPAGLSCSSMTDTNYYIDDYNPESNNGSYFSSDDCCININDSGGKEISISGGNHLHLQGGGTWDMEGGSMGDISSSSSSFPNNLLDF